MSTVTIRDAIASDEPRWRELWRGYCDFYQTDMPDDVTNATWRRILDPDVSHFGSIVAEQDGRLVGFANYVLHPYTWSTGEQCYLNDLFVDPEIRSGGIGHDLISFLQRRGAAQGWTRIHWLTHETNARARRLYDRFTPPSGFIQYVIPVKDEK
ncbi:MAG TPA: GNAT family N-acetyltransferase [Thermomicrobiales bacterium]|nr:GNAT family N-acetyltransferase [Thermomicrobiales bacterium]